MESSWLTNSVVRGHHVYKNVWTPSIGERLQLRRQDDNDYDNHAVSVVKAKTIVGHVPREMLRTFWHFIMHGGSIRCEITGRRTLGEGGGQINEGGAFTIPILSMWKNRGGRINEGGRSDGRLRYMYFDAKSWDPTCYPTFKVAWLCGLKLMIHAGLPGGSAE